MSQASLPEQGEIFYPASDLYTNISLSTTMVYFVPRVSIRAAGFEPQTGSPTSDIRSH
jgi:hypothetical protein